LSDELDAIQEVTLMMFHRLTKGYQAFEQQDELSLIQFPTILPIVGQQKGGKGKKKDGKAEEGKGNKDGKEDSKKKKGNEEEELSEFGLPGEFENTLTDIPEGYIGKLKIYKSGKIKLHIGDISYDVRIVWLIYCP
jgi:hypothetical protein